jgi:uncharacterized protein (TIGR02265 family)
MAERIVFEHSVESLYLRSLRSRLTPELKNQLRSVGVDLDRKLLPGYPQPVLTQALQLTARTLRPELPEADAFRWLGECQVEGYQETVVGTALFGVLRLLGPRRMLERTQKNFRSGNNYTEVRCTTVDPCTSDLWMNEIGPMRYFTQGIVLAGMRAAGAREARVEVLHFDEEGTTYRVAWMP